MQKYTKLEQINKRAKTAVALGYFDGVHIGHRKVINAAVQVAAEENIDSAVFTFNLPESVQNIKGSRIFSQEENERRIKSLGINHYYCPEFSHFCMFTPEEFVRTVLHENLHAQYVFCGENFKFGKGKSGDVEELKRLCEKYGIKAYIIETANYKGEAVSSTRIRNCLGTGDLESTNYMLGDYYSIDFKVKHGEKIGNTLGFPTINQVYSESMAQLKSGVYITSALVNNVMYKSVTGIGNRPTFGGKSLTCETFILNFNGEIYGEKVDVCFYKFLKPTVKFNTKEELKQYINSAVLSAEEFFTVIV